MSDIVWKRGDLSMVAFGRVLGVSCYVRNELNARRRFDEVVWSTTADLKRGVPYYPREFPVGIWAVGRPEKETDPYLAPYFIPTDAWQLVEQWAITERDKMVYLQPTGVMVRDYAYGIHCSTSPTTLGCLRVDLRFELLRLVDDINRKLDDGKMVSMEVVG